MSVTVRDWPEAAQLFWEGMCISIVVNGKVIVHPETRWVAEELLRAAAEDRMPNDETLAALAAWLIVERAKSAETEQTYREWEALRR